MWSPQRGSLWCTRWDSCIPFPLAKYCWGETIRPTQNTDVEWCDMFPSSQNTATEWALSGKSKNKFHLFLPCIILLTGWALWIAKNFLALFLFSVAVIIPISTLTAIVGLCYCCVMDNSSRNLKNRAGNLTTQKIPYPGEPLFILLHVC